MTDVNAPDGENLIIPNNDAEQLESSETTENPPNADSKALAVSANQKTRTPRELDLRLLDMRVGKVRDVVEAEGVDDVYTIIVDVKTAYKRTSSCSLFTAGFDVYDLLDAKVVTVLNGPVTLLPADDTKLDIRVLAAVRMGGEDGTDVEELELLKPPKKAKKGDRIYAEGYSQDQHWPIKEKNYKVIMKDLRVNMDNQVAYRGIPLRVEGRSGYVTTEDLKDCVITHI